MASKLASVTAQEVLPRNVSRKSLSIQNEDTTDNIFIKRESGESLTVSAIDHDFKVGPGGSMALNFTLDGKQAIQDRYTMIASANTPRVAYFETEDIER
jgi:hypothetical protein